MNLADLRRFSIRKQYRIHFRLRNELECVISEQGVAQVPALKRAPDFNLEQELAAAGEFLLEPVAAGEHKNAERPRTVRREEMAALVGGGPAAGSHEEHEEE